MFETLRGQFPGHAARQLGFWVERFFKLWCRNQWKRERYAPSFHLDDVDRHELGLDVMRLVGDEADDADVARAAVERDDRSAEDRRMGI